MSLSNILEIQNHKMIKQLIPENLQAVSQSLDLKANKDEIANGLTAKGNLLYANLPVAENSVGDYYYCSDGDGVNPAGNYVWNGIEFYFGGTGDEGYSSISGEIYNSQEIESYQILSSTVLSDNYFYENGSGKLVLASNANSLRKYVVVDITAGAEYLVTCSYNNSLYTIGYAYVDSSNNVLENKYDPSVSAWINLTDYRTTAPANSVKLYVNILNSNNPVVKKVVNQIVKTSKIGDTTNFNTINKTVVTAVNEVNDNVNMIKSELAHKSTILFNFDAPTALVTDGRHALMQKYKIPYTVNITINNESSIGYPDVQYGQNNISDLINDGVDFAIYSSYLKPDEDSAIYNSSDESVIEQFETYVETAKNMAETLGIFNPTAWFSRFNRTGTAMNEALIRQGFKMCRGYKYGTTESTDIYIKNWSNNDIETFNTVSVGLYPSSYNQVISYIDAAIENGWDLSVFTHNIYATESEANTNFGITLELLENALAYIKSKVDSELCNAMTYREFYKTKYFADGILNDYKRTMKYCSFKYS